MLLGFLGQVMRFVYDVDAILRLGQHGTATEAEIGKQEIMIRDDDIHTIQFAAGAKKGTLPEEATFVVAATPMIGRNAPPQAFIQALGPAVTLAVPCFAGEGVEHRLIERHAVGTDFFKDRYLGLARIPQLIIQALQAHITTATFG